MRKTEKGHVRHTSKKLIPVLVLVAAPMFCSLCLSLPISYFFFLLASSITSSFSEMCSTF
jgi:hypothetical protein